ncbi:hypothetical protein DITRI_Ditri05aG0158800 [Diplodiscus trichospermus]
MNKPVPDDDDKGEKMNKPVPDDDKKGEKMNKPAPDDDEKGEVFLDESDIIDEVDVDEEDLPDADSEDDTENIEKPVEGEEDLPDADDGDKTENIEEPDDSIHIFTGHTNELYAVACSPRDPVLVATGGRDEKGFLWKIGHAEWASELQWVKWHPKGHLILAGSEDCTVWMWNADNGNCLKVFSGHGATVTCGDFTPDGKTKCTGSEDATLRVWNPKSGESIHVVRGYQYHSKGLTCLSLSSDSTFAITGSLDGYVRVVNITTAKVVSSRASHTSSAEGDLVPVECVSFAPNFPWAVSGGEDRNLIIWDLQHSSSRFICNHEGVVMGEYAYGIVCLGNVCKPLKGIKM